MKWSIRYTNYLIPVRFGAGNILLWAQIKREAESTDTIWCYRCNKGHSGVEFIYDFLIWFIRLTSGTISLPEATFCCFWIRHDEELHFNGALWVSRCGMRTTKRLVDITEPAANNKRIISQSMASKFSSDTTFIPTIARHWFEWFRIMYLHRARTRQTPIVLFCF